jgi:hypothetical protein
MIMADFYGTAAGWRIYHIARGRNVDAYDDDDEINAALLVASERNDAKYRTGFSGNKVGYRAQVREFPRFNGFDRNGDAIASDSVPTEMINATYEAALRQLVEPGSLSVDWTPNKYKRASVDGAVSVEWNVFGSAMDAQTQFLIIDEIIAPILTGSGNYSPLSGPAVRV